MFEQEESQLLEVSSNIKIHTNRHSINTSQPRSQEPFEGFAGQEEQLSNFENKPEPKLETQESEPRIVAIQRLNLDNVPALPSIFDGAKDKTQAKLLLKAKLHQSMIKNQAKIQEQRQLSEKYLEAYNLISGSNEVLPRQKSNFKKPKLPIFGNSIKRPSDERKMMTERGSQPSATSLPRVQ